MKALEIRDLSKSYGHFQALDHISFDIEEGEFFGFLGPNGAGKTTTINSICGLVKFEGVIKVLGLDVNQEYMKTRALIGLSQQEFNLDNFFQVRQILYYQGGFFGLKGDALRQRVNELINQFKMEAKQKEYPVRLSGGMKRKVMIMKALIHKPRLLILDEPTAGLDIESRLELWDYLRKINQKEKVTILLTSHYIDEIETLCQRAAIISAGKIAAIDTVGNLKKKYKAKNLQAAYLKLVK